MHFPHILAILLSLPVFASADWVHVQKPDLQLPEDAFIHRQAARDLFLESYYAYQLVLSPGIHLYAQR
jgi:hypothetical protein